MSNMEPTAISTGDIAVNLSAVSKTFRQKIRQDSVMAAIHGLFKPNYRLVYALNNVSFGVRAGEVVAYAGPNGAGKSTTIRILSGLLVPDRGQIRALGLEPFRQRVKYMQRTGVLFGQRTELWWDQPVISSFEWKKVVWNIPDDVYRQMKDDLVELLGITPYLTTQVRELSLGQRMRADLAMALLHRPELLLLDEPTIGLDVLAKRQIISFLKEMNLRRGTTIVVTSHDMDDLMEIAGRIILLDQGRLIYDGDFERLRSGIGGMRTLVLTTPDEQPLTLAGAQYEKSEGNRHWYKVDSDRNSIVSILKQIPEGLLIDVETIRPPFEQQIAELYRRQLEGFSPHSEG